MSFASIGRGVYLEGLCADGDTVFVSDPLTGGVFGFEDGRRGPVLLPERRWVGGIAFDAKGRMLVSGMGGIVRLDTATGAAVDILTGFPGVNEMAIADDGGFYFGTIDLPSIAKGQAPGASELFHLAPDGAIHKVRTGLKFSNGLMLSPDGRTLYHNETWVGTSAYPVLADGSLGEGRLLIEKVDCDGLAVDVDGVVWITGFASEFLVRLAPDGTQLEPVPLPGLCATQIRFGGVDGRDLYVCGVAAATAPEIAAGQMPDGELSELLKGRADTPGVIRKAAVFPAVEGAHV